VKRDHPENQRDLAERTFNFAVSVIRFLKIVMYSKDNDVVKYQLAKSATSVGANYEEAQGAYSKEDFSYKISICFREAKETGDRRRETGGKSSDSVFIILNSEYPKRNRTRAR
jgi:hypothetical protein